VAPNPELTAAAQVFATLMARTDRLSHAADDKTPAERAKAHGYDACLIAENIASQQNPVGFTAETLAQGFFQGWQHSPSHRESLPRPCGHGNRRRGGAARTDRCLRRGTAVRPPEVPFH
jgi:uncharacterized protein YkwD